MNKSIVVLSGGQDSTTCLFWATQEFSEVQAISFDYGQRHRVELEAAATVAKLAGVPHEVIDVRGIMESASPLVDPGANLEEYQDFDSMDRIIGNRIELTFVPMRNALFLAIATNRAVAWGADSIVTGVCQQDNANYPDCREGFLVSMEAMIAQALGLAPGDIQVRAPLLNMSKAESIALAQELPGCMDALAYSHTCYAGQVPPCGRCHACVLRAEGFRQAGIPDPLTERFRHD